MIKPTRSSEKCFLPSTISDHEVKNRPHTIQLIKISIEEDELKLLKYRGINLFSHREITEAI
jgi:hypothetical protein